MQSTLPDLKINTINTSQTWNLLDLTLYSELREGLAILATYEYTPPPFLLCIPCRVQLICADSETGGRVRGQHAYMQYKHRSSGSTSHLSNSLQRHSMSNAPESPQESARDIMQRSNSMNIPRRNANSLGERSSLVNTSWGKGLRFLIKDYLEIFLVEQNLNQEMTNVQLNGDTDVHKYLFTWCLCYQPCADSSFQRIVKLSCSARTVIDAR